MWLGSNATMAVVYASSCSSNSTPSLGTFICHGCDPKMTKKKKKKKRKKRLKSRPIKSEFLEVGSRLCNSDLPQ